MNFQVKNFLPFWFKAANAHGLHSPFLYELYQKIIANSRKKERELIHQIKKEVFTDQDEITFADPKDGSRRKIIVSKWAKRITSSTKFISFLWQLVNYIDAKVILETGTAFGVNASAMTYTNATKIITLEGSLEIANKAKQLISRQKHSSKVDVIVGKVQETFSNAVKKHHPDLIFLDADHRSETIKFYIDSILESEHMPKCIIIHDIYWSQDMNDAWMNLTKDPRFSLTVDIFEAGLIFPDFPIRKQHFKIRF